MSSRPGRRTRPCQSYVRDAAGQNSADQLAKLADLHNKGVISDQEFEREKAKILAA